jgi:hypothetical protein
MKNIFLILIIASSVGCKYKMEQTIKKGYFDSCPKYDVETMIESYFADPKWESFISPDDNNYHLNVSGRIMYNGQESKAILQFELLDGKRWKINAFEINGEEQNDFMTSALISEMCSSAEEAAAKAKAAEEAAKVNRNTSPGASAPAAASPKQPQSAAAVIDSTSAAAPAPAPAPATQIPSQVYYRIQDPDGYSNLRDKPDGSIVRKVYPDERFEVVGQSGRYKLVEFNDGSKGYIHESRVSRAD